MIEIELDFRHGVDKMKDLSGAGLQCNCTGVQLYLVTVGLELY